ncbi:blue copper protein-like [Senna tora]|uniref:Blue copper protein-like n=1 Tax=Senna tora TaxID=362788 RepID=A0A834W259_9FABA|nr:blue copper protein-like [Senna tora]
MARSIIILCIVAFTFCTFLHITASAQEVHVVGDDLGWAVPPAAAAFYQAWALSHTFHVGDILLFNFTDRDEDVAQVTKEALLECNTSNPIAVKKTSPANFTLDAEGDYYFTSTFSNHCASGQILAVHVFAHGPSPVPSPAPKPRGPRNYTVGGVLGWLVPPGGEIVYDSWASVRSFQVGDALVFLFVNGTQDVAVVTKEAYDKCETNSSIAVYSSSPTRIVLDTIGEHYYTSTYKDHCCSIIVAMALLFGATEATEHVVGGSYGWNLPPNQTFYSDWATSNKFFVGDSLVFILDVDQKIGDVSMEEFENCTIPGIQFGGIDDHCNRPQVINNEWPNSASPAQAPSSSASSSNLSSAALPFFPPLLLSISSPTYYSKGAVYYCYVQFEYLKLIKFGLGFCNLH